MGAVFITIFLLIVGAAVIFVFIGVIVAYVRQRRLAKTPAPPAPSYKCPACDSEDIDILTSGLWDGEDLEGRSTGGLQKIGTCKHCGVHSQYLSIWTHESKESRYEIRKLTDEEWNREFESREKWTRHRENWPFTTGDQNRPA